MRIFFIVAIFLFLIPYSSADCPGCLNNEKCYYVGSLIEKEGVMHFCNIEGIFEKVKSDGESCQNDFECKSGLCSSGDCVDLYKETTETSGRIQETFSSDEGDATSPNMALSKKVKVFLFVAGFIVLLFLLILFYILRKYKTNSQDENPNTPMINSSPNPDDSFSDPQRFIQKNY